MSIPKPHDASDDPKDITNRPIPNHPIPPAYKQDTDKWTPLPHNKEIERNERTGQYRTNIPRNG
jgi:hypothetical protein